MSREDLHFRLRIPEDLKAKVETSASRNHRSMTAEIVARLEASFSDGERRDFARRMDVLLDQEARTKDQLLEALGALKRKDLKEVERILKPLAWYERSRADFTNVSGAGANDERS